MLRGLVMVVALIVPGSAVAGEAGAEYAIRWSAQQGGPMDLDQLAALLKIDGKSSGYTIRYFEVVPSPGAAGELPPIVRERKKKGDDVEITWKYRGSGGFPAMAADRWQCPLRHESKRKDEIDVSFLADGSQRRSYSRSCTANGPLKDAMPKTLKAVPKGCGSTMKRLESRDGRVTAEAWKLDDRDVVLEVSAKGPDTADALKAFERDVVALLIARGAEPLDRSKTEIGTQCGG